MKFLAAILVASFSVASALAADLPLRTYTKAPVYVEPVYDWTGFYIGLNGGYSWGNSSNTFTAGTLPVTTASQHMNGWVFGGQAGYNWQMSQWLFGLETDIQGSGIKGTATQALTPALFDATSTAVTKPIDWFGTVRGRLGVLATPQWLLYATGGLAYGQTKTGFTTTMLSGELSTFTW